MSDEPRMYGGNSWRKGVPEDTTCCIASVWPPHQWSDRQCNRKRGHGPGGLYCKQHAKVEERVRSVAAQWAAEHSQKGQEEAQ